MALTKADMRNKVLRYLALVPEGDSPTSFQSEVVESAIEQLQAQLEELAIAYWETSAIPNAVATPLRNYIAAEAAPELMEPERAAPYVMRKAEALGELRTLTTKPDVQVQVKFY